MMASTKKLEVFDRSLPDGTPLVYEIVGGHLKGTLRGIVYIGEPAEYDVPPGVYEVRLVHPKLGRLTKVLDLTEQPETVFFRDMAQPEAATDDRFQLARRQQFVQERSADWEVSWWTSDSRGPMLRRGGTSAVSPELGSSPVESPLNYAEAGIAVFDVAEAGSIAVRWPPGASRLEIQRTRSGGVVLRPRTGDLRAESMLDYAMEGYSAHASMIRGDAQARELIDREHQSPAGALIGAYYLVKTGEARRYVELLDELNQNFPELPDTAVALGSSLLQADAPRELIRGAFLQAASLGIPIYREGLRQLRAGLDFLFAEGHDDEIVAAIEAIRPHQMALHYDNAVTSWSSWPGTAEPAARASLAPTRLHLAEAAPPLAAAADDDGDTEVEAGD